MRRSPRSQLIARAWLAFGRCLVALLLLSLPVPAGAAGWARVLSEGSDTHAHDAPPGEAVAAPDGCPCCEADAGDCTSCAEDGPCSSCPPGCPGCSAAAGRYAPSVASLFVLPDAAFAALIGTRVPILVAPHPDQTAPYRPPRAGAAVA